MKNEEGSGFEEVVPGVLVNKRSGFKIIVPHPDPVTVIRSPDDKASMTISESLCVFSNEEMATSYMGNSPKDSYILRTYAWDALVDAFGGVFPDVIVDPKTEPGFVSVVPLRKGI